MVCDVYFQMHFCTHLSFSLTDELILILLYSTVVRIRLYKLSYIIPKYQNGQQFLLCHIYKRCAYELN